MSDLDTKPSNVISEARLRWRRRFRARVEAMTRLLDAAPLDATPTPTPTPDSDR